MTRLLTIAAIAVALAATMGASVAKADPIPLSSVNVGAFSWWDLNRFGPQNLVGQHTPNLNWFAGTVPSDQQWLKFNLNGVTTLNTMTVTNYGGGENRKLSSAPVEYSLDGITWINVDGPGGIHSFNTNSLGVTTVNFGGVQARLVRIGSPSVGYVNNGEAGNYTGLREVAFDGTRVADTFVEIAGSSITATASTAYAGRPAANTVNGAPFTVSGENQTGTLTDIDGIPGVDTDASHQWYSAAGVTISSQWIKWEFDSARNLQNMLVWNCNISGADNSNGVKSANLKYSLDGIEWTSLGTIYLTRGTAPGSYDLSQGVPYYDSPDQFNLGGVSAKFVMLDNLTILAGTATGHVGLTAVKFYEGGSPVPEPATLTLLAAGGLAAVGISRRRRKA